MFYEVNIVLMISIGQCSNWDILFLVSKHRYFLVIKEKTSNSLVEGARAHESKSQRFLLEAHISETEAVSMISRENPIGLYFFFNQLLGDS